MSKVLCAVFVIVAFVSGVFVGRMPVVSLIFDSGASNSQTSTKTESSPSATNGETGTVISTANLSAGQQRLLSALGVDANNVTVTPTMIACAEAAVGAARIGEITSGATPTFAEGLKLLACYK